MLRIYYKGVLYGKIYSLKWTYMLTSVQTFCRFIMKNEIGLVWFKVLGSNGISIEV